MVLFTFADYWWFYLTFIAFVFVVLALDLGVFHKKAHEVSFKESCIWTAVWISLALIFNYGFYQYALWRFSTDPQYFALPGFNAQQQAETVALEFLTGFVVEKSLAIDTSSSSLWSLLISGFPKSISIACCSGASSALWSSALSSSPWVRCSCAMSGWSYSSVPS